MHDESLISTQHDDAPPSIASWLESARQLRSGDLSRGLAFAAMAWDAALKEGYVAEQIEAGRLRVLFHLRRGEFAEVVEVGQQLLPLQRMPGSGAPLCELLRWITIAAAELGEYETALSGANEAIASAREMGEPMQLSMAINVLGACFERMGDPWQAERLMHQAAALLGERAGSFELMATKNNLATVALGTYHLLANSGHERECTEALERALQLALDTRPHALSVNEPYALALTDGNRGEVLLHLGRLDEAETLLRGALNLNTEYGFLVLGWRVRCSLAELALARGRAREALAALQDLLAETAGRNLGMTGLRILHAAYRAGKAMHDDDAALTHLEHYQALERRRSVAQLKAQARFFLTRLEAEQSWVKEAGHAADGDARATEHDHEALLLLRDPLTGLGNRRCMEARMPQLMRATERRGSPLTVALIDVDRFEAIGQAHGTAVCDRVLQVLSQMLADNTRDRDLLLRRDGEEFLVALPDTGPDRAFEVCERLRQAVEHYAWHELAPGLESVTLSIGLANAPPYATDLLIARAESAMYRAKHLGRNRVALA